MMEEKVKTEIFRYEVVEGVSEYHAILRVIDPVLTYQEQVAFLLEAYNHLILTDLLGSVAVFKRFFLSDAANQADYLMAMQPDGVDCALSIVEQPPLDGTKIALWVSLQKGVQPRSLSHGQWVGHF